MLPKRFIPFCALASGLLLASETVAQAVEQQKTVVLAPGFSIYLDSGAEQAIETALRILQRDLSSVLGKESVRRAGVSGSEPGSLVILTGAQTLPGIEPLEGWERHKIFVKDGRVILHGADVLGTVYAVLAFSEEFLGVKPLWFWASQRISRRDAIPVGTNYYYDSGEPHVRYRAWFPNDTDLVTPWRKLSEVNNEIWVETMLRLGYNTVESQTLTDYSRPYAVNADARLFEKYGMHISFTHTVSLNSHYSRWDDYWTRIRGRKAPELLLSRQTELEEFWRYNVQCLVRNGIEPIWGVAFRGHGDVPFWDRFADAPASMPERAEVINAMVRWQVEILKEETGNPSPTMKMTFYNEVSDFLAQGLVIPPAEENLIWNFVAARRDHYPNEDMRNISIAEGIKLGYYLNLQFTSTGSHLAPAEGPWKMERNIRFVDAKNREPIHFVVLNAGNFREYLTSLSAAGELLWNPSDYDTDAFLLDYSRRYFGAEHAPAIARLYRDFFYAYWQPQRPQLSGFDRQYVFQDLRYKQAVRQMASRFDRFEPAPLRDFSNEQVPNRTFRIVPEDHDATDQVEAIIKGTTASRERFAKVVKEAETILPLLESDVARFLEDNLAGYARFMMHLNDALRSYTLAYQSNRPTDRATLLEQALTAAREARASLHATAHGPFDSWYENDSIFDLDGFVETIEGTFRRSQTESRGVSLWGDTRVGCDANGWSRTISRWAAIDRDDFRIRWSSDLQECDVDRHAYLRPASEEPTVEDMVAFDSSPRAALLSVSRFPERSRPHRPVKTACGLASSRS
jgi:hypothetical protein